jgi:hypothetical protein
MPNLPTPSGQSAAPLHLVLEPSPRLRAALAAVHGLAALAALLNPLPLWLRLGLVAAVAASLRRNLRAPAVRGLSLLPDGHWEIVGKKGVLTAAPGPATLTTPWLAILDLRSATGRHAVLVPRDSVDPESFRRLRVHLRIHGAAPPEP